MSFYQFLSIMRGRWQIVVSAFLACVLASQLVTLHAQRQYTAVASVVVDPQSDPVATAADPGRGGGGEMETQTDIVTSQRVAERVARILGFDKDQALQQQWRKTTGGRGDYMGWVATSLLRCISVQPPRESNVIDIQATWSDGKNAARIANAFAQGYIETTVDLRVQPEKQYAAWYDERSQELRAELEHKQRMLSDYQQKEGLLGSDEHLDTEMTRLEQLETQLVALQTEREDSESRDLEARGSDAAPEIIASPVIGNLRARLVDAKAELDSLAIQLGPANPEYKRAEAQVNDLQQQISREGARILASLHEQAMVDARREQLLNEQIAAQKLHVTNLKHERDGEALLESDVAAAQRTLDAVTQGLAQTSLESQSKQANAALLTRATEPAFPSSPKVRLNLAIGLFLGAALGIALGLWVEKLDQRVRTNAEIRQLLAVPLLATFSAPRGRKPLPKWQYSVAGALGSQTARPKALGHQPSPAA